MELTITKDGGKLLVYSLIGMKRTVEAYDLSKLTLTAKGEAVLP